jgi:predicted GIY-YIG superfamily endonuclease
LQRLAIAETPTPVSTPSFNNCHFRVAHRRRIGIAQRSWFCCGIGVTPKRFVYILKSIAASREYYVGVTSDFNARLTAHNAGLSPHTAANRPWRRLVVIAFDEEEPALKFERFARAGHAPVLAGSDSTMDRRPGVRARVRCSRRCWLCMVDEAVCW